jgi:plasmid stabilization system protein ParE
MHPAAIDETEAALVWYQRRSERVARAFLDELERVIDSIARNPAQFIRYAFDT